MNMFFGPKTALNLLDSANYAANQSGQVTPEQEQRLRSMAWGKLGCLGMFFSLFAVPFIMSLAAVMGATFDSVILAVFLGGVALMVPAIFIGKGLWDFFSFNNKLGHDLQEKNIRQGQATLAFENGQYVLMMNERSLPLPASQNAGGLLPGGRYSICYLEESGLPLSASEPFPTSPAQLQKSVNDILGQLLGFGPEDLDANRNGEVTPKQRQKLWGSMLGGLAFFLVPLLIIVPMLIGGEGDPIAFLMVGGIGLVFAVIGIFVLMNTAIDMFSSTSQEEEGVGTKISRVKGSGKNRRTHYYYVLNNKEFEVDKKAFDAFIEGLEYRVYYLPRTSKLIAIECTDNDARISGV